MAKDLSVRSVIKGNLRTQTKAYQDNWEKIFGKKKKDDDKNKKSTSNQRNI